ncbi:hypothetical protein [Chryseobacterium sp. RR2-3-20]|uniref:hypothetical protein n=1 Tax=Chryseobacterium sp. RR2-3-20 TaxID=2787626 RepID=UPI001ADF5B80|nr:hypothetical protein [Chryseobacterium sp. RR2-3-20]
MLKYLLILLGAYLLYYAGNIVYDLFLKKEKAVQTDATEEFSLGEFAEKNKDKVQEIGIDDVENLNTPKSFSKRELIPTSPEDSDEIQDVEYWREKFESEENMDDFNNKEESTENTPENAEALLSKNEEKSQNQHREEPTSPIQKLNTNKWHQMLNLAETSVQLIANTDGFKTYQSMM